MDRPKATAQWQGNEKFVRRPYSKQQQQQPKNYGYPYNNNLPNRKQDAGQLDRARDRRSGPPYKDCILDETPGASGSKSHFKSVSNKAKTNNLTEPKISGASNGTGNRRSEILGTLRYAKMLDNNMMSDTIIPFMRQFNLDDVQNYAPLTSDCFVREIGDYYYCALCCSRERINSRPLDAHTTNQKHVELFLSLRSRLLNLRPSDDSINMVALEYLATAWLNESVLTDTHSEARIAAISDFCAALAVVDPSCHTRIIGSFYSGTSLSNSDVNLELIHPNSKLFHYDQKKRDAIHHKLVDPDADYGSQINKHTLHYDLISNPVDTMHKFATILAQGYSPVGTLTVKSSIDDLNRKTPTLVLLHEPTQVTLEITCYAESSYKLACLLKNYMSLDKRALELSILVKHWAKICNISNPKQGTMTPETLVILVIDFLQRVEPPVLPCLHELLRGGEDENQQRKNEKSLIEKFESINLTDNQNCDDNETADEASPDDVVDHEDETTDQEFDPETIDNIDWHTRNTSPVHKLFIEFLEYSMKEFSNTKEVVSIRSLKRTKKTEKAWNTEIKPIENPVKPNVNMAKNIGTVRTYDYIKRCFAHGFYYLTSIPMVSGLKRHSQPLSHPTDYIKLFFNWSKFDFYFSMREAKIKEGSNPKKGLVDEMINQNLFARDVAVIEELIEYFIKHNRSLETLPVTISNNYDTQMLIPQDSIAAVFCWLCRTIGHQRSTCPRKDPMTLKEASFNPTIDAYVNFDEQFLQLYVEDMIQLELAKEHHNIVQELEKSICAWTGRACELKLFGSTVNLLGSSDSDLDICMTLKNNATGNGVDCVQILGEAVECLKENPNVAAASIEPILQARVPIIKFKYKTFDIDLSMYNQCAVHNSMLLRTYVLIDYRVPQLFYLVKRYAKACSIADASRGSLSSYAWSLLVIHFLQHTSPPILPVLQETVDSQPKPVFGVNGWNVWFNDAADNSSMPQNNTNLTSLFKQFLFYYANFDFNQYVVSIRTTRLMTKFQKNWTNCMIAIEDPFELTYNLSGRLDDPMALYIRNSFAKTYKFVYTFQQSVQQRSQAPPLEVIRSLFRGHAIMGSEPPYRGCRVCHRIGHKVKECPERARENNARQLRRDNNKQHQEQVPKSVQQT